MSNETQKADQIAFHVYTKLSHVVTHARSTVDPRVQPKVDKWFNLETLDSDFFTREAREPYRSLSSYGQHTSPPPLEIQVLLTIPELASNQVLVHLDTESTSASPIRSRIEPTPRFILLESFVLDFAHHGSVSSFSSSSSCSSSSDVAPSTMYKHGIPLFRSLYTMLRVMPAWKVYKRLKRRIGRSGNIGIIVKVKEPGDDVLEFGMPLASQSPLVPSHILPTQAHTFLPVPHPHGAISLTLQYLTNPTFQIDDKESLFSSGFLAGDKAQSQQRPAPIVPMVPRPDPDVEFVPTLTKNQQRDSIASSSGLGYSASPGHGLTSQRDPELNALAIADRFILPPQPGAGSPGMSHSRSASLSGSGSNRTIALPGSTGPGAGISSGLGLAGGSRSRTNSPRTSPRKSLVNLPAVPLGISSSTSPLHGRTSTSSGSYPASSPLQPQRDFPRLPGTSGSPVSSGGSGGGGVPAMPGSLVGVTRPLSRLRTSSTASNAGSPSSLGLGLPGSLPQGSTMSHHPLSPVQASATMPPTPTRSGTSISPISVKPFKAGSLAGGVSGSFGSGAGSGLALRPSPPSLVTASPSTGPGTSNLAFPMPGGTTSDPRPAPVPVPGRKRYSSSFSHRYTSSVGAGGSVPGGSAGGSAGGSGGGSNVGSAGSGGGIPDDPDKPRSKLGSPSFLQSAVADDEDISHFVQDIEARKPLIGRQRMEASRSNSPRRPPSRSGSVEGRNVEFSRGFPWEKTSSRDSGKGSIAEPNDDDGNDAEGSPSLMNLPPLVGPRNEPRSPLGRRSSAVSSGDQQHSRPGLLLATGTSPVLTSADDIDERLRKMNEAFLASLEGLGSSTSTASGRGGNSSGSSTHREREFGTLGRGREWQQRPRGQSEGTSLGALFNADSAASSGLSSPGPRGGLESTGEDAPTLPPLGDRRPSPFLGRLREQYGGGGDSGSSSEVAGLAGSSGSGSGMGTGRGVIPGHLGQMSHGSEEVIGNMDMEADLDSQVFGKRPR